VSRGPGVVQLYIRDQITSRQECIPVVVLAKMYAEDRGLDDSRHLRSSCRRAAANLIDSGAIRGWELRCPTRLFADGTAGNYRWAFCVAPADMEITEKDEHGARVIMALMGAR
jgi:hypothetical protein